MHTFGTPVAIAAILATSSALVAAAPASAAPQQVRVAIRDLDLSTDAGRRTLRHRLDNAVDRVCPAEDLRLELTVACRRAAMDDASTQLAQIGAAS